jgi:uncharacterized protein YecT (DUF1311 family)
LAPGHHALAAGCGADASQTDLTICADQAARRADASLNDVYKRLMAKIEPADQARLQEAERAWLAFRDKECTFLTGGGPNQQGTIWPMMYSKCIAAITQERVRDLTPQLKCPSWNMECGVPFRSETPTQ